jgi:hypothetical protein
MPYYLVQAGNALSKVSPSGVQTALTLPSNITVDSTQRMQTAILGDLAVVVNSPNENISVDRFNNVSLLTPRAPSTPVTLAAGASGGLNGAYQVKYTFIIKDQYGNLLAESGFSPVSATSASLVNQLLLVTNIGLSVQPGITGRRLYRTTTGPGSAFYQWIDVDSNVATTVADDLSDVSLQTITAPTDLGSKPRFSAIAAFANRLWARTYDDPDNLLYSGSGRIFAWSASQSIPIPPAHTDITGITSIIARRDELGVAKASSFHVIRGTNDTNFTRYTVAAAVGVVAQNSVVVVRDTAYFLGNPLAVYSWGASGIEDISSEKVKKFFATDTSFNRGNFSAAVGAYDPVLDSYILLLSAPGQTTFGYWLQYNLTDKTWWGPHLTSEFTPTYVTTLADNNNVQFLSFGGSNGKLYQPQSLKSDGSGQSAIDFDVRTGFISGGTPSTWKLFNRLAIVTEVEAAPAGNLQVIPTVDGLEGTEDATLAHDLSLGNEQLARLGPGRFVKLRFRQNEANQNVVIYGVEIPFHELGERNR